MKNSFDNTTKILKIVSACSITLSLTVGGLTLANAEKVNAVTPKKKMELKYFETNTEISNLNIFIKQKISLPQPKFTPIQNDIVNYDLRNPSNLTAIQINEVLAGTQLEGLGEAYVEAEKKFKVNSLYLIAHSALESGWGQSRLSINKNNLFGIQAYDDNPYESASYFESKEECILFIAEYISNEYLVENGEHYNGPNLAGMNEKYASDKEWAEKIAEIMSSVQNKVIQ